MLRGTRIAALCYHTRALSSALDINPNLCHTLKILIVGDGNFSYSVAIAKAFNALSITATSLDTKQELLAMYPTASQNLLTLKKIPTIQVRHGIDATKLASYDLPMFDRIVFNFPHSYEANGTRHNKISNHRRLLLNFLLSCQSVLATQGQVWIALCAGQGGTFAEEIKRLHGDTWQIEQCAANANMLVTNVTRFPLDTLTALGYESTGYRKDAKGFYTHSSLYHVLSRPGNGITALYPLKWCRDMSFWAKNDILDTFPTLVQDAIVSWLQADYQVDGIDCIDTYTCMKRKQTSFCFRINISTKIRALSEKDVALVFGKLGVYIESLGLGEYRAPK
ncbi:hypothetical protein THRCLA_09295 [Thraustotheca clavata]|uniref:25S rRNA (uridine-N(3))-methyltransferase BMT5-like domain-containing protein n=1 Tax=Thraustotheca clavata TaxID=74557 RepID=A0A1V9YY03_9STRA|nr:hypothetical protein THRCLA_09295 [Thraustotheca clavata]